MQLEAEPTTNLTHPTLPARAVASALEASQAGQTCSADSVAICSSDGSATCHVNSCVITFLFVLSEVSWADPRRPFELNETID